jgi:broad specificity phosphatase PhoE
MPKNNFFVIRHGESENNILEIDSCKLENKDQFGLSKRGKKEIELEANKFKDFDLIISSPFRRAKETAKIFAKTSECKVIEDELLREVDVGDFELCKYKLSDAFFEEHNNESVPYPNGESLLDVKNRTMKFLELTNQIYNDKKILIVTHGWIVFYLLRITDKNFDSERYLKNYDEARYVLELKRL